MQRIRMAVQKTLMAVFLVILYGVGFGLTALFLRLFKPHLVRRKFRVDHACWCEASGYEAEADDLLRQA